MNKNDKMDINLNPIISVALQNKFFIFIFGILSVIVGYIYISQGESYYKSSLYISQVDNYNFILKKSTQNRLTELSVNPVSLSFAMVKNASSLKLLEKIKSSLGNYNELELSVESSLLAEDPNRPFTKRWLIVSKGNFKNKSDSKLFLSKLINMAYEDTLVELIDVLNRDIVSIKENYDLLKLNYSFERKLREEELTALIRTEKILNKNKTLRKISLLENEIAKAELLNFDKPQFEFILRLPKENYVFNNQNSIDNKDNKDVFGASVELSDTEIFDSDSKLVNLNYFYGVDILSKEIEFLKSDKRGDTSSNMIELTTNLETLDLYNSDIFIKALDDNFINSLSAKRALEDIKNNFIINNDYAVNFRTDKIKTYLVNALPKRYALPIFFILGLFIGLSVKFFSYNFEYKKKIN